MDLAAQRLAGNAKTTGLAELSLDATQNYQTLLSLERLFDWHGYLFAGPHHKRQVHFEAPPREGLAAQLKEFLQWLAESEHDKNLVGILRAAQAHL